MQKRLLILGGSDFQIPFVKRAKEMGLFVGVVDFNENAPRISLVSILLDIFFGGGTVASQCCVNICYATVNQRYIYIPTFLKFRLP